MEEKRKWRYGVNRWIILALIIVGIILAGSYPPLRPHIQLPAESILETAAGEPAPLFEVFGLKIFLTNTLIATVLADLILLIIVFFGIQRAVRSGSLVPKGVSGAIEALLEVLYNLTESTAGAFTRKIFPWFAAITMLVLVVNWMELIPGVDTIGVYAPHHAEHYFEEKLAEETGEDMHTDDAAHAEGEEGDHEEEGAHTYPLFDEKCRVIGDGGMKAVLPPEGVATTDVEHECASAVVPFVRVASTDLNFTISLAVISLFMTQVIGVQALGIGYFEKFFNVRSLFSKPFFGVIDFAVGIFEIVSEFSKIISFSFRLFGNIFAGSVLLFVIGALIPVFAQSAVLMLEFGVGLIQAIVFGMLTMVFMAQATHSHHGDEEHH